MRGQDEIIAVGLLTAADLVVLGQGFRRAFAVDSAADFTDLLLRIDQADRAAAQAHMLPKSMM